MFFVSFFVVWNKFRTKMEQTWNKVRTIQEKPIPVPKTLRGLKFRLTVVQKKQLCEELKISYRLLDYILKRKRTDTRGVLYAGQRLIIRHNENLQNK